MFWTAGQRYDVAYRPSSFVWKSTPGTGSCCGEGMSKMSYTHWSPGEPYNAGGYDPSLNLLPRGSWLPEKCVQLCSGWDYKWNDAVCEIPTCSICEYDIET